MSKNIHSLYDIKLESMDMKNLNVFYTIVKLSHGAFDPSYHLRVGESIPKAISAANKEFGADFSKRSFIADYSTGEFSFDNTIKVRHFPKNEEGLEYMVAEGLFLDFLGNLNIFDIITERVPTNVLFTMNTGYIDKSVASDDTNLYQLLTDQKKPCIIYFDDNKTKGRELSNTSKGLFPNQPRIVNYGKDGKFTLFNLYHQGSWFILANTDDRKDIEMLQRKYGNQLNVIAPFAICTARVDYLREEGFLESDTPPVRKFFYDGQPVDVMDELFTYGILKDSGINLGELKRLSQ